MSQNMFLPNYTIGQDAYKEIKNICEKYGTKIVFIGGKTALEKASFLVRDAIKESKLEIIDEVWYGGEASYENVEMLMKNENIINSHMIFAFGGGKACDTCKVLSEKLDKPLFTFPTIASTCASVTSVCAMYYPNGVYRDLFFKKAPAVHTFINTQIIAEAPTKYLWAGIGDTLGKGYEPEFSARGKELDYPNKLGITLSSLCKEPLFEYGDKGLKDCENNISSKELEETILTIIVTTGLVSNSLKMSYNSGLAHAVCYGFSTIKEVEENHLHGELVSYGVLVLEMMDKNYKELDKLINFYKKINLPISYKNFNVEIKDMTSVFDKASSVKDIEVSAFSITKDMIYNSIKELEEYISKN
ncbi:MULTISPECIES: iron-containing alcohol dehydrogenase family protein [Fusobacterium]|uniref:iron-containing alcohol dehydrogenase family protein n=1 Tax=Fusobacterium TaxID=848 RepID=UPI0014776B9F|nr:MULTISPECIES: iron-containing alcohol dehydrogenase family protein [Fusobacterium]NME36051.1 iron-containing alcohol dehydrogenase family protein [Fusobacterium sp. FSA-380-WT-3A]